MRFWTHNIQPLGAFGQNTAASTGTSAFGAPKPATGFGAFGGGTSAFGGGGSTFGGTSAGTSGTNVFGSTTPSTGSAFGAGSSLFGQPKPATTFGATPASTPYHIYEPLSRLIPSNSKYRRQSTTCDDRHVYTSLFCLQRKGSFEPKYHPPIPNHYSFASL